MGLDESIKHGKERRKPYYRSGKYDKSCRPGGTCPYCKKGRLHKHKKQLLTAKESENDYKMQS